MKIYIMTWEDKAYRPGLLYSLESAKALAAKKGVTDWREIFPGTWKSGHWFIDEFEIEMPPTKT